ncbi:IPT/TIG domain-containing protein [Jatrophihabitans endophyticus]|uniref:IPT/TIG domain-containing protein n=1 Tax=Jatrophihabitans endophyticus TaxID=1206085 RepID=A0A1M5MXJ3_9ACTN|nr:IPT/TIG domain-containing protein [Jatrophihabitans endophyticus]SHG82044.1 IPT/TIG domain-containing protein [Jatrophihabitans endophyticus]
MRFVRFLFVVVLVGGGVLAAAGVSAEARAPRPVITSVEAAYGSSVGYAHLIIHGRHLTGGTVTVAGRRTDATVIDAEVITAFPAGHRHGTRFPVVVRTKAGTSNTARYEFRHARQPGTLRAVAAEAAPGGKAADLEYSATRCPAVGTCISLGSDFSGAGPVARVTTNGRTITQRVPVPADSDGDGTADLADLACPTATYCVAVGGYNADSASLISTWDGRAWTSVTAPVPPEGDNGAVGALLHVACGGPGHCVAFDQQHVYTLDGGTWQVTAAPVPAGSRHVVLDHVSCPVAGWCTVTGSADTATTSRNIVAVRAGTTWTSRFLPNPPHWKQKFNPDVDGLDCAHRDRCTLLAGGLAGGGAAPLSFATLHGGAVHWTAVPVPADARSATAWAVAVEGDASLRCPTTGTCWALAAYSVRGLSGRRGLQPVALRLHDGTTARVFPMPRPATSRTGWFALSDLACANPSACVAVGSRGDGDANDVRGDAIVETYADGVWTPVAAPSPKGRPRYSGYEFTAVDCAAVGRCTAVGDYNYDHDPDAGEGEPLEKSRPVILDITPR